MTCRICGASLPSGAMFCGECGSSTTATALSRRLPDPRPAPAVDPLPAPGLDPPATSVDAVATVDDALPPDVETLSTDVEAPTPRDGLPTRPERTGVPRFTLAFSTGETVVVSGTGLIGRRPLPQPAEFFDTLVTIDDRGLSVSKTHLEFGNHEGELWVNDRFSGNGTLVRRPDGAVLRCEPGRRYLVPRGSQLDLGDVSLIVS